MTQCSAITADSQLVGRQQLCANDLLPLAKLFCFTVTQRVSQAAVTASVLLYPALLSREPVIRTVIKHTQTDAYGTSL